MLPSMAAMVLCSVAGSPLRLWPVSDITKPTVQKPHCEPPSSTMACCTGVSWLPAALMPSTVTMCLPAALPRGVRQLVMLW